MPTTTIPILLALAVALTLTTCERNKLLDIDPHTGYFTYADGKTEIPDSAVVIKNTPFDLDAMNDLVVVNNHVNIFVMISRQDFTLDMVNKIGYFNQTMSIAQLRALIATACPFSALDRNYLIACWQSLGTSFPCKYIILKLNWALACFCLALARNHLNACL